MTGRRLSHYEIVSEISRGGMGIVYRAVDVRLNREVALKVLVPELVTDPDRRRRFVQEAQAASALEHPHIAVIHEIDEADGVTFIAMELVRGENLGATLQRTRPPVGRTLELAVETPKASSSFGVLLYEMLAGERPFRRTGIDTLHAIINALCRPSPSWGPACCPMPAARSNGSSGSASPGTRPTVTRACATRSSISARCAASSNPARSASR